MEIWRGLCEGDWSGDGKESERRRSPYVHSEKRQSPENVFARLLSPIISPSLGDLLQMKVAITATKCASNSFHSAQITAGVFCSIFPSVASQFPLFFFAAGGYIEPTSKNPHQGV